MRKTMLWITMILLLLCGCGKKTVPQATPTTPASDAPAASAAPSDAPEASADPTDAPKDAAYRESEITLPSRGVQVHATVVLPGATAPEPAAMTANASPEVPAVPDASPALGASQSPKMHTMESASPALGASQSPEMHTMESASPALGASQSPKTHTMESASPDASMQPGASPDASMKPETSALPDLFPIDKPNDGGYPLVVFLHGHGGERNENGGFTEIAHRLAGEGIASVRFDFAGSGQSEEAFPENTLTSMKTDTLAVIDYMKATYPIDETHIGVFGFDMGGRVALQLLAEKLTEFDAAVLLAPANRNADWIAYFGGQAEWDRYKADAELNNHTTFTTLLGQVQDLSIGWFTDLEAMDDPAATVGTALRDRVLILYADNDTTVSPDTSKLAAQSLGARTVALENGGHSYGFYAENRTLLTRIADETASFFAEKFGK